MFAVQGEFLPKMGAPGCVAIQEYWFYKLNRFRFDKCKGGRTLFQKVVVDKIKLFSLVTIPSEYTHIPLPR